ncbi:MAG: imidazole glycerol phosphate synthase subunit HisH, partial [Clostridiales bacterium]|nr:imidazole glycerol phosphate synthase subunit HisH [Clostridiales bacterium]
MIAIVDYKMGNLASVRKALEYIHRECVITDDPAMIAGADALILPGVGAYAPAMEALRAKGLDVVVKEFAASGKPMLGICLGMQLMLSESEEGAGPDGNIKGLGIIPGSVKKFPSDKTVDQGLKVPQIG